MTGSCVEQFRDMIPYPCCPQYKAGVEMSAHGRASHPCPNCGKFVEFDYDNLTAKIVKPTYPGFFCFKTKLFASLGFSSSDRNELTKEHLFDIIISSLT